MKSEHPGILFMHKRSLVTLIAAVAVAATTCASAYAKVDQTAAHLKAVLQQRLGHPVKGVTKSPIAGLYEVNLGPQLVYSDAAGNYLLIGNMVDTRTNRNLTEERLSDLNRVSFANLPFGNAVKVVHGNGSRRIAVFSDPNCPYCRIFENTLRSVNNVTVYTFLFPVLSADSMAKAKSIWCSPDRAKAWEAWILDRHEPAASGHCNAAAISANLALGQKFNVTGTPTIILANGQRLPGAVSADELNKALNALH
jgi:thiol:disulfide interchange protein DsbC